MRTIEAIPLTAALPRHGGKAEGLAALLAAGLPVPPGVVFDAAPRAAAPSIASAAVAIARVHAWDAVAVRSSADGEDGAVSSGAGAYETVLSVPAGDVEAMTAAVDTVLGSIGESGGVIVQQMVRADAAGVTFTVDPLTGGPAVVVNAVAGLGAALVSGAATPWVQRFDRDDGRRGVDRCARRRRRTSRRDPAARGHPSVTPRRAGPRRSAGRRVGRRGRRGVARAVAPRDGARRAGPGRDRRAARVLGARPHARPASPHADDVERRGRRRGGASDDHGVRRARHVLGRAHRRLALPHHRPRRRSAAGTGQDSAEAAGVARLHAHPHIARGTGAVAGGAAAR